MATFAYKARDTRGEAVSGTVVADNQFAAARILDERKLAPIALDEVSAQGKSVLTGQAKKIPSGKVGQAYEQLADLLNAGVPMLRSLNLLSQGGESPALSSVLKEVHEDVAGGDTLADALDRHPNAFNPLHVAMIRAGEKGGFLEEVLSRLSDFISRQDELRGKFIGALIYPIVLVCALVGVVIFMMTFVVPRIESVLKDVALPLPTQIVFGASYLVRDYYFGLFGGLVVAGIGIWAFMNSDFGKRLWAQVQLRAPGIGPIYTMVAVCRFCRILGTLLSNGIPIIQALDIARSSAGNEILAQTIGQAAESVREGEALTKPLAESKLLPPTVLDMIAVAEESNTLDKTLIDIANTQEARTARQIDIFMRVLEPLLLVLMAGVVAFIAIALLLPILTLATSGLGR